MQDVDGRRQGVEGSDVKCGLMNIEISAIASTSKENNEKKKDKKKRQEATLD